MSLELEYSNPTQQAKLKPAFVWEILYDLDGEGLMLDGQVYQALGDGAVKIPAYNTPTPFWVTTDFVADRTSTLTSVSS